MNIRDLKSQLPVTFSELLFYIVYFLCLILLFYLALLGDSPAWGQSSTWTDGMRQLNSDINSVGPGCVVFVEEYSVSGVAGNFRSWKRCGANAVESGRIVKRFEWRSSYTAVNPTTRALDCFVVPGGAGQNPVFCTGGPLNLGDHYYGGPHFTSCDSVACQQEASDLDQIYRNVGCSGATLGDSSSVTSNYLSKQRVIVFGADEAANPFPTRCKAYDTLLRDMGRLTDNCAYTATIRGNIGRGKFLDAGCGCGPMRYAVVSTTSTSCVFAPVVGDPTDPPAVASSPGSTESGRGAYSGGTLSQLGTGVGGGSLADGFAPSSAGFGPSQDIVQGAPESGTGSGGSLSPGDVYRSLKQALQDFGSGGGFGGGGLTEGQSRSATKGALDDEAGSGGGYPGQPTFLPFSDSDKPALLTWVTTITNFLSSSPLVTLFTGTHFALSGSTCSLSTSFTWGTSHDLVFDFCASYLAPVWTLAGAGVVVAAYIFALFIIL